MRIFSLAVAASLLMQAQEIRLTPVVAGLSAPTDIQNAGDGSGRLFVVEQRGTIRIVRNGALLPNFFLDIRDRVSSGGERGLLGLAFPPGFAQSGRFYVNYTNASGNTVIAQYRVGADPDRADQGSEVPLLTVNQPFANHNGGQLAFGPDGFLYIGMGDGGSGGDPQGHGQNPGSLLGKMLRVDVESSPGTVRIPPDNPFAMLAGGTRPEIWATGLRNPWRFSFDAGTGDLWIADVGQNLYEEVNFQAASSPGGENYGWNRMEGLHCFQPNCSTEGLTLPVVEYPQTGGNCSVTGGYVYRGSSAALRGFYIYGDYCSGMIWGIEQSGGGRLGASYQNRLLLDSDAQITTFGQDEARELYLANARSGQILRIEATGSAAPRFSAANVVNAASFRVGLVAGSLGTVFATGVRDTQGTASASSLPLPTAIEGVSVKIGEYDAPVLAVANNGTAEQVNFQVPFEIAGRENAAVIVTRNGLASAPQTIAVHDARPGVFSESPNRALVVHNAGYTLVTESAPLTPGEVAFVYATGLGAVTNAPATGAGAPVNPLAETRAQVRVTLGGQACDVLFAGLAPGLAGVYQINFRVPAGAGSGLRELVLGIGAADAPGLQVPVQ